MHICAIYISHITSNIPIPNSDRHHTTCLKTHKSNRWKARKNQRAQRKQRNHWNHGNMNLNTMVCKSVAFSNDGSMLVTEDGSTKTTIYDVKTKARYMNLNTIVPYTVALQTMARCLQLQDDAKKQRYMMSKQKQRYMNLNTIIA